MTAQTSIFMGFWTHINGLMDVVSGSILFAGKLRLDFGEPAQSEGLKFFISLSYRPDLGFFPDVQIELGLFLFLF